MSKISLPLGLCQRSSSSQLPIFRPMGQGTGDVFPNLISPVAAGYRSGEHCGLLQRTVCWGPPVAK
jgi:hypothetical protein